jgi:hypothetical protein
MTPLMHKGLWVAVLQLALVGSLGAKFTYDRATRPHVWVRTAPVDPNLPIRGRYVRLRVEAAIGNGLVLPDPPAVNGPRGGTWTPPAPEARVVLTVQGDALVALPALSTDTFALRVRLAQRDGHRVAVLDEPLAFFIPEHVADPSRRAADEELWVEVTVPRDGPPRPIRLGVKKDGVLTPVEIK